MADTASALLPDDVVEQFVTAAILKPTHDTTIKSFQVEYKSSSSPLRPLPSSYIHFLL